MACKKCGNVMEAGSKFCTVCGAPAEAAAVNIVRSSKTGVNKKIVIAVIALAIAAGGGAFAYFSGIFDGPDYVEQTVVAALDEEAEPDVVYEADAEVDAGEADAQAEPLDPEAVVSDFIWQFSSIFLGWGWPEDWQGAWEFNNLMASNGFAMYWRPDGSGSVLFDMLTGGIVTEPHDIVYLHGLSNTAQHFSLFHLNDGDIPAVVVSFRPAFANGPWFTGEIYVFENGEYRLLGTYENPRFFVDENNRIILTHYIWGSDSPLYYVNYIDGVFGLEAVAGRDVHWDNIDEIWGGLFDEPWLDGRRLSPLPPLEVMGERILQNLSNRAGTELEFVEFEVVAQQVRVFEEEAALAAAEEAAAWEEDLLALAHQALPAHLWERQLDLFWDGGEVAVAEGPLDRFLAGATTAEIRIARNTIFAMHGRRFADPALQAFFDLQPWYTPALPLGAEPTLSARERLLVEYLQSYE